MPLEIIEQDYINSAHVIGCEIAVIKAIAEQESRGKGFLVTGEVRILFEPHIFWEQLVKNGKNPDLILKTSPKYEDILYKHWGEKPYGSNSLQWDRLRKAAEIDLPLAYMSASFGKFQIMGFNYKAAGFHNVIEYAKRMEEGENMHLYAFTNLVMNFGLQKALKNKDFRAFARVYNGPSCCSNKNPEDNYDNKLRDLYKKYSKI